MGYYQGDFYRGARGDPGFFSFIGGAVKSLATSFLGLPARAAPISTAITKVASSPIVKRVGGIIAKHPVLTAAGAAGATGLAGAGLGRMGSPSAAGLASAGRMTGGGGGRRRRMRVTNPKALRRALRRAYGFERLAMRTIHLLHPKKKGRFGGFRRPKKRK